MAHRDALTNLANRREFDRYLSETLLLARQRSESVALVMIDVDYFKRFNDTYGHIAGDACILPGADAQRARTTAVQAAAAVSELNIPHLTSGLAAQRVTLSAGYAAVNATGEPHTAEALIRLADQAFYLAKQAGHDRVQGYDGTA